MNSETSPVVTPTICLNWIPEGVSWFNTRLINYYFSFFKFLSLAALGLCCCTWAFSSCGERGLLFVVVRGLLIAVASLVVDHRL